VDIYLYTYYGGEALCNIKKIKMKLEYGIKTNKMHHSHKSIISVNSLALGTVMLVAVWLNDSEGSGNANMFQGMNDCFPVDEQGRYRRYIPR